MTSFDRYGLKMEILDVVTPNEREDCSLAKCKLSTHYESPRDVLDLAASIPPGKAVLKDTFILPAGGAVVTRVRTGRPSLWYAHCHLEMHHLDGMASVLNVGNYSVISSDDAVLQRLPEDMPSCNTPFVKAQIPHPSCDCYQNPNSILGTYLTSDYKCSREHLCHHVHSRVANLGTRPFAGGDEIHSEYQLPGWAISFTAASAICLALVLTSKLAVWTQSRNTRDPTRGASATIQGNRSVNPPPPNQPKSAPPKSDGRRLSSECIISDGRDTAELSPEFDLEEMTKGSAPEGRRERSGHNDSCAGMPGELEEPEHNDEEYLTKENRDQSSRIVSDLNKSNHLSVVHEQLQTFTFDGEEKKKKSTISAVVAETAHPLVPYDQDEDAKKEKTSSEKSAATGPSVDAHAPFSEQLKHILSAQ